MHKAYLSLGSNQGDRIGHLAEACHLLQSRNLTIIKRSPVYETAPWGFAADTPFLNAVIEVNTLQDPYQLHRVMIEVEAAMGRLRQNIDSAPHSYASRCIDLDVLFFDDLILDDQRLTIPHPRLHLRNFVLVPLADLAPHLTHPLLNQRIDELLAASNDVSYTSLYGPWPENITETVVSKFT